MLAGEEADEVRGRVDRAAVDHLHAMTVADGRASSRVIGSRYAFGMPAQRRDAEGTRQIAPSWESLIERQIREATEAGAFDELPYQGEPLPLEDDTLAGDRAMGFHILRNAGVAPSWIEADKAVRTLLDQRDRLLARAPRASLIAQPRARAEMDRLVGEINAAVLRLNSEAPTYRQHRQPLDRAQELARLEAAFPRDQRGASASSAA